MKIISSYISGVKSVFQIKKIVFVLYFINLIFALAVAIPFASALSTAIGFSDALTPLAVSYNFTAMADFLRDQGNGITNIFSVGRWLIPIYLLLQIFLNGGIIGAISNEESTSLGTFYNNCTTYFWKYLKVFFGFLLFHLIGFIIVAIPMGIIFSGGIDSVQSEITYWTTGYWGAGVYFVLFTLIMIVSDYTKILLTKSDSKGVFKTILKSWKLVFKNITAMYPLFLLNFLVVAFVYWINWQLGDIINPSAAGVAIAFILIQQIINIIRIYAKVTYYSSMAIMTKEY